MTVAVVQYFTNSLYCQPYAMFKKLKQKIEEGGDGGIEKVAFSPRKLPGSVIRSSSQSEEAPAPQTSETTPSIGAVEEQDSTGESRDGDQGVTIELEETAAPSVRGQEQVQSELHVPNHIIMKSSASYEVVLEAKIRELEQECSILSEKMSEAQRSFDEERTSLTKDIERLDKEATELKLEIVELQLEKSSLQQRVDEADRVTEERVAAVEVKRGELQASVEELQQTVRERDKELMDTRERYSELEEKLQNMGSTLEAYGHSSDSEVIHRLQSEVASLEKTIDARNLDIQILERRVAAQAKVKDHHIETGIENQQALKLSCNQLREELSSVKSENKQLLEQLKQEQKSGGHKEREMAQLHQQLRLQSHNHQQLVEEVDSMKSSHAQQLKKVEGLVQEKDSRISELLMHLRKLRGEAGTNPTSPDAPPSHSLKPPGSVRRTTSVAVQTSMLPDYSQQGSFEGLGPPAVLPLGGDDLGSGPGPMMNGNASAAMKSLGPEEELEVLRQEQLRLEEEVSEKAKIIRLQQQKIIDMRKELQRTQSAVDLSDLSQIGSRMAPPRPHPPNNRQQRSPSPPPRIAIASDVNFQYLKHVVMKFICSREDEALQLVRAIAVLLELSPQEERHIKDYLDYKMSWFGSMPPPLYQPMNNS